MPLVFSKDVHVIINMAMSLDGKVSSASREPVTFTSLEDKLHLQTVRAQADALIVAAHTAKDYTTMGVSSGAMREARVARGQSEHPLRVVVSGSLSICTDLPFFKAPVSPILIVCCENASRQKREIFSRLGHLIVCGQRELDARKLINVLATEYRCRTIVSEGGPTLNDVFFRQRLVDELYVTICPKVVGGATAPTVVDGKGVAQLKEAARGHLVSMKRGKSGDWFLRYRF